MEERINDKRRPSLLDIAYINGKLDAEAEQQQETPSEKELGEVYLKLFDKKYILPTLKGKQLADFKDFLNSCQQRFGLKYWGIHPTQAKLFEKMTLLWAVWGAEHLKGIGTPENTEELDEPINYTINGEIDFYEHGPIITFNSEDVMNLVETYKLQQDDKVELTFRKIL